MFHNNVLPPLYRRAVPSIKVLGPCSPFKSPWARNKEDEEYLSRTLSRLGEIVKDDVKLGTLYLTLVLATPSTEATQETKVDETIRFEIY